MYGARMDDTGALCLRTRQAGNVRLSCTLPAGHGFPRVHVDEAAERAALVDGDRELARAAAWIEPAEEPAERDPFPLGA